MDPVKRRRFIAVTATGSVGLVTGCTGDGDGEDGAADGGENATDDGDTGEGMAGDGEGGADGAEGTMEDVAFGGVFTPSREVAFEVEMKDDGRTVTGRIADGDQYIEFETEQGTGQYYMVGDEQYVVMEEQDMCIANPGGDMEPSEESQVDTGEYENTAETYADLSPSGTETIDGVECYVFEIEENDETYYVAVDTGNLRRVESPNAVVDFRSWGDVEPIEKPDMECQDLSEMPMSPDGF